MKRTKQTPEQQKAKAREYRLKKAYGIDLAEYTRMLRRAEGRCEICLRVPEKSLNVDHVHIKGFKKMTDADKRQYIRGLACFVCNHKLVGILDRYKNPRVVLKNLQRYFKRHRFKYDQ